MSLREKKIAVIGASGDIGLAIADWLQAKGAVVVEANQEACNVTSLDSVRSFLAGAWAAKPASRLDGIVLAHGAAGCVKPSLELTDEEFERVLAVDVTGAFRVMREAMRYMGAQGYGNMVVLSSIHAIATYPERAAYAAAKAGVVGLVKALAIEWVKRGVRVNAVLPGQVYGTRRTDKVTSSRMYDRSPSGRLVDGVDVAQAVAYLLDSSGVNGHSLTVDDGWTSSAYFNAHT